MIKMVNETNESWSFEVEQLMKWLKEGEYQIEINDKTGIPGIAFQLKITERVTNIKFLITKLDSKSFITIAISFKDPQLFEMMKKVDKYKLEQAFFNSRRLLLNKNMSFRFEGFNNLTYLYDQVVIESSLLFLEELGPTEFYRELIKVRSAFYLFSEIYTKVCNFNPFVGFTKSNSEKEHKITIE